MIATIASTNSALTRIIRASFTRLRFMSDDVGDDFVLDHRTDFIDQAVWRVDPAVVVQPGVGMALAELGPKAEQIADETVGLQRGAAPGDVGVQLLFQQGKSEANGAIAVAPNPLPGAGIAVAGSDDGDIGQRAEGGGSLLSGIASDDLDRLVVQRLIVVRGAGDQIDLELEPAKQNVIRREHNGVAKHRINPPRSNHSPCLASARRLPT